MNRVVRLLAAAGRRTVSGLLLLIGASLIIYITIRSAPGDAIDAITPMGTPPEVKALLMEEFGLDRDPMTGYIAWLSHSARGDFGESLVTSPGSTVLEIVWPAFKQTLALSTLALGVCLVLALCLAIILGEPSRRQTVLTGPLYFLSSAPSFVVAVVFIQIVNWGVHVYLEVPGYETPPWYPIPGYLESVTPYFFAGFALIAGDGLFMDLFNGLRAELLTLRNAQFITAVRAKGAKTRGHIALNMVVPIVSGYMSRLPIVLGGVVIVEYIFTLEGAGYLLLEASKLRDFPVVVGLSVLFTATVIVGNVIGDLVQAIVDPREVARGG